MPRTLFGTGGTNRELVLDLAADKFSRGHSTPLGGHFRPEAAAQMTGTHLEATILIRKTGKRLIICGDTVLGTDDHVCGA